MKDYTITLKKILGKEKYEELVDYTFKNIRNKKLRYIFILANL